MLGERLAAICMNSFCRYRKFFPRDCIQSLRWGVMLAERKKWKLANNVSAEPLRNAAERLGILS